MFYRAIELEEGAEVQFVGCYVLKFPYHIQEPEIGFVEAEGVEDLLDALKSLLETQDMDTERPPWTYHTIYRGVACCYCGCEGEDTASILHLDYDGGICPVAKAQAAIAKAEWKDPKARPVPEGEG